MGNVSGTKSPPSAFRTEYNGIKTTLVQMQTVGIGVLETLKSYADVLDNFTAENACQAPEQKSKFQSKTDDLGQHNHIQKTRDSLQNDGVLRMQSILESIKDLDLSIQTIFIHFAESFPQSLKKAWQQSVQNCDSFTSCSGDEDNPEDESDDGQVGGRGLAIVVEKQEDIVSLLVKLWSLEDHLETTENKLNEMEKKMRSQLNINNEYIKSLEAKLREAERQTIDDTNTLKTQIATTKIKNSELQSQLNSKIEYIQSIEAKLREIKQQTADDANSFRSKLSTLNSQNRELQSQLNSKTENVKSFEAELRSCKQQTAEETNSFRLQLSTLESQNKELQSQLSTKIEYIQSIEAKLCKTEQQTTYEATRLRSQLSACENLNKELQLKLRTETEYDESILCEKMKTFRQQEDKIRFLTDKIHDLKTTVQTIQTENSHLNEQLRRQRTVDLQIWFQRTDILTQVAREIQEQVKTKCQQTAGMVVNCFTPVSQADLKPGKPIILLCINAFGPNTDVPVALNNIQGSPDVAVIVLHHKAKHALPYQSSDKVLTSPVYKQLGAIFDMAFLAQQGIYHCDMNEKALKGILEFLKYKIFQREW